VRTCADSVAHTATESGALSRGISFAGLGSGALWMISAALNSRVVPPLGYVNVSRPSSAQVEEERVGRGK